jgi:hypothetical protein
VGSVFFHGPFYYFVGIKEKGCVALHRLLNNNDSIRIVLKIQQLIVSSIDEMAIKKAEPYGPAFCLAIN